MNSGCYEAWKLTRSTWRIWTADPEPARKLRRRKRVEEVAEERTSKPKSWLISWERGIPCALCFDVPAGYHRPIFKLCERAAAEDNRAMAAGGLNRHPFKQPIIFESRGAIRAGSLGILFF